MQHHADRIVYSPTDLNHFLECEYLTQLDLEVALGRALEQRRSPEADLLAEKGESHERQQLAAFQADGLRVAVIADPGHLDWSEAAEATIQAMRDAADIVYQAVLIGDGWRGRADFLVRVDRPSALGGWSYEAWDTKLARHVKPAHILQLAFYSEQVAAIQQASPVWMHVVLGTNQTVRFRCDDCTAYFRVVRSRFERALAARAPVTPYPVSHCYVCGYADHCHDRWHAADHLSSIAGIRRSHVELLEQAGIHTSSALGVTPVSTTGINPAVLGRLQQQAALQTHFRTTGTHRYELLPPGAENGFRLLPPPSAGDIFFDMEGDPFFEPAGGLEYLFGARRRSTTATPRFHAFPGAGPRQEKAGVRTVHRLRLRSAGARGPTCTSTTTPHYEPSALKRLMSVHATREEELDDLLRREVFVDLYQVVRQSCASRTTAIRSRRCGTFFMADAGQGAVTDGGDSILRVRALAATPAMRRSSRRSSDYNEEDCVSTLKLRDWLLERRAEAERALRGRNRRPRRCRHGATSPMRDRARRRTWTCAARLRRRPSGPAGGAARASPRLPPPRSQAGVVGLLRCGEEVARRSRSTTRGHRLADARRLSRTCESSSRSCTRSSFPPQEFKLRADGKVRVDPFARRVGRHDRVDRRRRGRLGLQRGIETRGRAAARGPRGRRRVDEAARTTAPAARARLAVRRRCAVTAWLAGARRLDPQIRTPACAPPRGAQPLAAASISCSSAAPVSDRRAAPSRSRPDRSRRSSPTSTTATCSSRAPRDVARRGPARG